MTIMGEVRNSYPSIVSLLKKLKEQGEKLAVATLKSQTIGHSILHHYGIGECFDLIIGMDPQETLTKRKTIDLAIAQTATIGNAILVGDSPYDYDGATESVLIFWAFFTVLASQRISPIPSLRYGNRRMSATIYEVRDNGDF